MKDDESPEAAVTSACLQSPPPKCSFGHKSPTASTVIRCVLADLDCLKSCKSRDIFDTVVNLTGSGLVLWQTLEMPTNRNNYILWARWQYML